MLAHRVLTRKRFSHVTRLPMFGPCHDRATKGSPAQLGLPESVPPYRAKAQFAPIFSVWPLGGGRLFRAHVIKHTGENRNVGLVLDQRTEMIGVK